MWAAVRGRRAPDAVEVSLVLDDVVDGVANGFDVLGLFVRDLNAELLVAGVDDLDHGQRVDVEVVNEGLLKGDLGLVDTSDVIDDVSHVGKDLSLSAMMIVPLLVVILGLCARSLWVFSRDERGVQGRRMTWPA